MARNFRKANWEEFEDIIESIQLSIEMFTFGLFRLIPIESDAFGLNSTLNGTCDGSDIGNTF